MICNIKNLLTPKFDIPISPCPNSCAKKPVACFRTLSNGTVINHQTNPVSNEYDYLVERSSVGETIDFESNRSSGSSIVESPCLSLAPSSPLSTNEIPEDDFEQKCIDNSNHILANALIISPRLRIFDAQRVLGYGTFGVAVEGELGDMKVHISHFYRLNVLTI